MVIWCKFASPVILFLLVLNMKKFAKFEAADYLDSEEVITEFLNASMEDENPEVFLAAITAVVKAVSTTVTPNSKGSES